ncbi:hypothetical protein D3C75_1078060 [compost metagenome]
MQRQMSSEAVRGDRAIVSDKPSRGALRSVSPHRQAQPSNSICDLAKQSQLYAEEVSRQVREVQGIPKSGVEAMKQLRAKLHLTGDRSNA